VIEHLQSYSLATCCTHAQHPRGFHQPMASLKQSLNGNILWWSWQQSSSRMAYKLVICSAVMYNYNLVNLVII
jgi:hypothetical protein